MNAQDFDSTFEWRQDPFFAAPFRLFIKATNEFTNFVLDPDAGEVDEDLLDFDGSAHPSLYDQNANQSLIGLYERQSGTVVGKASVSTPQPSARASSNHAPTDKPDPSSASRHETKVEPELEPVEAFALTYSKRNLKKTRKRENRLRRETLGEIMPRRKKVAIAAIASVAILALGGSGLYTYNEANKPDPLAGTVVAPVSIFGTTYVSPDLTIALGQIPVTVAGADAAFGGSGGKVDDGTRSSLNDRSRKCEAMADTDRTPFPSLTDIRSCLDALSLQTQTVNTGIAAYDAARQAEADAQAIAEQQANGGGGGGNNGGSGGGGGNDYTPPSSGGGGGGGGSSSASFTVTCTTSHTVTISGGNVSVGGQSGPSVTLSGGPTSYSGTYTDYISISSSNGICSLN